MDTKRNDHEKREIKKEPDRTKKPPAEYIKRINPRYVFSDPKAFFDDLLMEQQEQQ